MKNLFWYIVLAVFEAVSFTLAFRGLRLYRPSWPYFLTLFTAGMFTAFYDWLWGHYMSSPEGAPGYFPWEWGGAGIITAFLIAYYVDATLHQPLYTGFVFVFFLGFRFSLVRYFFPIRVKRSS